MANERALLPPVDPDALIKEDDPEKLRAYARGLLDDHLKGRSGHYDNKQLKAATVWLVGQYVDAQVPLAPEMYPLISGITKWDRTASTFLKVQKNNEAAYWAAIEYERTHPDASDYAVAKHVREGVGFPGIGRRSRKKSDAAAAAESARKTAESTIRGWRKIPHYRLNAGME